ncbi:nitroreductase family protein [Bacillus spongiae]|uniref:Nitroreductase family protein n=1 Tax=Bacillus spongiae TaxID=2683610 RepID=A0ABU8HCT2_9BACI
MEKNDGFISLDFERLNHNKMEANMEQFVGILDQRQNEQPFIEQPVMEGVIEKVIQTAGTAPSGANQQPWTYVVIRDDKLKKEVRRLAEKKTLQNAEQLEKAPLFVALFKQKYAQKENKRIKHYYPNESTAISAGFFLSALLHSDLDYVAYPPLKELKELCHRPKNEESFLLFAVGYKKEVEGSYEQASHYYENLRKRRNVRDFSAETFDEHLLITALEAIMTTPFLNGGNYHFEVVSDSVTKQKIRQKAEEEEKKFYEQRITDEWKEVLRPLGTDWRKPHLTDAPHLIVAFKGEESPQSIDALTNTGVATGVLLSALHQAGLAILTHTPSPMTFLRDLLGRPKHEMPIVVLPVGFPIDNCKVPKITKKPLQEILVKHM